MTIVKKIRISEYRELIRQVNTLYNIDLSNHTSTSLKRRVEDFMVLSTTFTIDNLITKIERSHDYFEDFLYNLTIPTTELFRDGEAWLSLKSNVLSKLSKQERIKIWIPEASSGEELYTLLIVLKEANFLDRCKVVVSAITQKNINEMKSGSLVTRKLVISEANYQRYKGINSLSEYYVQNKQKSTLDADILKSVEFKKHYIYNKIEPFDSFDLVIFRNRMLYYNKELQNTILSNVYNSMNKGGYIFIGVQETLNYWQYSDRMKKMVKNENIFRKQK